MISVGVHGHVTVKAVCPQCGGSIASSFKIDKNALTTGNTTEKASYHLAAHEAYVHERMLRLLWTKDMCGRCRIDAVERERTSPRASNGQGAE